MTFVIGSKVALRDAPDFCMVRTSGGRYALRRGNLGTYVKVPDEDSWGIDETWRWWLWGNICTAWRPSGATTIDETWRWWLWGNTPDGGEIVALDLPADVDVATVQRLGEVYETTERLYQGAGHGIAFEDVLVQALGGDEGPLRGYDANLEPRHAAPRRALAERLYAAGWRGRGTGKGLKAAAEMLAGHEIEMVRAALRVEPGTPGFERVYLGEHMIGGFSGADAVGYWARRLYFAGWLPHMSVEDADRLLNAAG